MRNFAPRRCGARGRDELLLADGQIGEERGGRQGEAEIVEQLLGFAHHAVVIEHAGAHVLVAEEDVGGDGQVRAEHDLLVHGVDAEPDRFVRVDERDRLALPQTSPEVRGWTAVSTLIRVDLPAPFSPTMAWISPSSKARSTALSACVAPKLLSSFLSERMGTTAAGAGATLSEFVIGYSTNDRD